jgi:translocation and assembly module TamA
MGNRVLTRLCAGFLCLSVSSSTWGIEASIEGLEGDVADNVRYYLVDIDESEYSLARLESEVQRLSRQAMRVYGYYEPSIVQNIIGEDPPERVELVIDPGPRIRIDVLDLRLEGDASEDDSFQSVIADFTLKVGDPLLHAPYDRLRGRLANLSLEKGYFDWRFIDRRMEVRPYDQSARLYLALDSGPRYRFGEVSFRGSHIEEDRLRTMQTFSSGDPYLAAEIARFNQRLGQTNWFSSVTVRPRLRAAESLALPEAPTGFWTELDVEADFATVDVATPRISQAALQQVSALHRSERTEVPIDVSLTPADRHQFEIGVGFATDVGPRTRFAWNQPWINRRGHGLDNSIYLSAPEQRMTGEYTLPLANPLRDSYRFQYGFRHRDNEDTQSLEATVEAARRWDFDNGWIQRLYLRSTLEDFTQAGESEQVWLLYPGVSWSRTRTRNPTFPSWGDRQRVAFEVSDGLWGSSADFLRMTGDTQWIRMFGDDNRFITRLGLGAIETDEFGKIPPSLRFFTGGDRSVRGYAYESLAPSNARGELLGGQQLLTFSAEIQRRVTGDWWGAAFIDAGDAFDDWSPDALNTGAGIGVRWVSPVGPIRLDIAHPFDDEDNSWRLHFAIGPEF